MTEPEVVVTACQRTSWYFEDSESFTEIDASGVSDHHLR